MTSQYDILTFFCSGNDQDTYPRQCAKFGRKKCKGRKLALNGSILGSFGPAWIYSFVSFLIRLIEVIKTLILLFILLHLNGVAITRLAEGCTPLLWPQLLLLLPVLVYTT